MQFLVEDRRRNPSNYALMTASEGAHPRGGSLHESGEEDAYGHKKLGGIAYWVSQEIRKRSGVNIMYEQLAYIMLSGAPDSSCDSQSYQPRVRDMLGKPMSLY
jgi:6-phosphofructokinase 1